MQEADKKGKAVLWKTFLNAIAQPRGRALEK